MEVTRSCDDDFRRGAIVSVSPSIALGDIYVSAAGKVNGLTSVVSSSVRPKNWIWSTFLSVSAGQMGLIVVF